MYKTDIKEELISALKNDRKLEFRQVGNELRDGVCPKCGEKELYVSLAQPWRVQCRRANNCNYSESTRSLYPEIFENLSKKHPATDDNPHATADAYLSINRYFSLETIEGMYEQSWKKLKNGTFAATIRFPLWEKHYWERIIDSDKVAENEGKKAHISYGTSYTGRAWIPKGMEFKQGDTIFITEGIFKSISFLQIGKKSISALSCTNLPSEIIKEHSGKRITWVLAGDNDQAGISYTAKHLEKIKELGEKCLAAFPEHEKVDWDDEYRNGRLTDKYIEECIWRGYYFLADTVQKKAFYFWAKHPFRYTHIFHFNNALYSYAIDGKKTDEIADVSSYLSQDWSKYKYEFANEYIDKFSSFANIERISNCNPQFLYIEKDTLTDEQFYYFQFDFMGGNSSVQVSLDGGSFDSPASFNKSLLVRTPGGTFDGRANDLKKLRDEWFNKKISYVKTVPFIGYDKESKVYIFPDFAFHNGKLHDVNEHGFISIGKERLKCGFKSMNILKAKSINLDWINDFIESFSSNGLVLMSWWLGSLFAEQIRSKQQSWPFLEYTGDQGAGKSTQIEFMWKCMGRDNYEGFDPSKSTHAGRSRNFQQVSNLPVILLEGDRAEQGAKQRGFDMDELKTAYNGRSIRSMGIKKRGAETEEPEFRGAILISQNATVSGSDALLSRIIHCHCTRSHFTLETEKKARRLASLSLEDTAGFLQKVLENEDKLLQSYFKKFDELEKVFREKADGIQPRLILNHTQTAAWTWQLPFIFGEDKFPSSLCYDLENHIWERCVNRQQRLLADHPYIEQFWDIYRDINFVTRTEAGITRTKQILNHSTDQGLIAINLNHFQEIVMSRGIERISTLELKKLLPTSRKCRFLGQQKTRSSIDNSVIHCWLFENSFK